MFPKLHAFFFNCLLPELADGRLSRGLQPRSINFRGETVSPTKKTNKNKKPSAEEAVDDPTNN